MQLQNQICKSLIEVVWVYELMYMRNEFRPDKIKYHWSFQDPETQKNHVNGPNKLYRWGKGDTVLIFLLTNKLIQIEIYYRIKNFRWFSIMILTFIWEFYLTNQSSFLGPTASNTLLLRIVIKKFRFVTNPRTLLL